MGYYADLIKEKRNATDYKVITEKPLGNGEVEAEVAFYRGNIKVAVKKFVCKREDVDKEAESIAKRYNSKEEKDNANFNIVRKFYYKECLVSVTKLDSGKYSYIIEKDGREEGSDKSFSTQSSAETDAKKEVEAVWNEKEEKENDRLAQRFARNGCYVEIYQTPSGRYRYKVTKDGKTKETFASVSDTFIDVILDAEATADKFNAKEEKENSLIGMFEDLNPKTESTVKEFIRQTKNFIRSCERKSTAEGDYGELNKRAAESYKKEVEKAEKWLAGNRNEKEEKDNDSAMEEEAFIKAHRLIDRLERTKNTREAKQFLRDMNWSDNADSPSVLAKDIIRATKSNPSRAISMLPNSKDDEKGYYAKLAEEKKNARKIIKGKFYLQGEDARAAISMGKNEIKREVEKKVKNYTSIDIESDGFVEVWMDEKKSPRVKEHFFKAIPYVTEKEILSDGSIYYARYDAKFELQYQGDEPW